MKRKRRAEWDVQAAQALHAARAAQEAIERAQAIGAIAFEMRRACELVYLWSRHPSHKALLEAALADLRAAVRRFDEELAEEARTRAEKAGQAPHA